MRIVRRSRAAIVPVLVFSACGSPPPEVVTAVAPTEYMAVGIFNGADPAAGTVNISHPPVPAAGWPAMTMDFKLAEPGTVAGLEAGDRVDIHFTVESGMNATITRIAPIE